MIHHKDSVSDVLNYIYNSIGLKYEKVKTKDTTTIEKSKSEDGIGLENIQKRLKMLYTNAHTLEINENDQRFKVSLTLQLSGLKSIKNV